MLQFTATRDGREVGTVEVDEATGSADEIEERIRLGTQRLGRIALELALRDLSDQTPPPCCCGHAMHSRGRACKKSCVRAGNWITPRHPFLRRLTDGRAADEEGRRVGEGVCWSGNDTGRAQ